MPSFVIIAAPFDRIVDRHTRETPDADEGRRMTLIRVTVPYRALSVIVGSYFSFVGDGVRYQLLGRWLQHNLH